MARPPSHSVKLCRRPPLSLLYPSALGLGFGVGFSSHLPPTFLYHQELGSLLFDFRTLLRPARLPPSPGCHAGHLLVQRVEFANRLQRDNQSTSCTKQHHWIQYMSAHILRNACARGTLRARTEHTTVPARPTPTSVVPASIAVVVWILLSWFVVILTSATYHDGIKRR